MFSPAGALHMKSKLSHSVSFILYPPYEFEKKKKERKEKRKRRHVWMAFKTIRSRLKLFSHFKSYTVTFLRLSSLNARQKWLLSLVRFRLTRMLKGNRIFRDRSHPFDTDIRWWIHFLEIKIQTRRHNDHNRERVIAISNRTGSWKRHHCCKSV